MWKWLGCQGLKARASFLQTDRKPLLGLGGLLPVCRDPVTNTIYVEACVDACACVCTCVWRSEVKNILPQKANFYLVLGDRFSHWVEPGAHQFGR